MVKRYRLIKNFNRKCDADTDADAHVNAHDEVTTIALCTSCRRANKTIRYTPTPVLLIEVGYNGLIFHRYAILMRSVEHETETHQLSFILTTSPEVIKPSILNSSENEIYPAMKEQTAFKCLTAG